MVYIIPKNELEIKYIRSSGPGGQNINKVSTKVRLDKKNNILIISEETRFQKRNEDLAIDHLNFLVSEALIPEKERIPTKPTKASKINKLKEKKEISFKKQLRKKVPGNYEE